jgi:hypothetical protein
MLRVILLLICLCIAPVLALATEECPVIVKQAYESIKTACEQQTARNQACYGNLALTATPRDGVNNFSFAQVGDIADVANIQSLQLSGMDLAEAHWGVVMMKLQANVPDTLPQQNVTFMLFGDVEITNAVPLTGETNYTPMQAFYFKAGFNDRGCAEAPESGVMVQGPKDVNIQFNVNNVSVSMGSTLYLQTDGTNKTMRVNVLDGAAEIEAEGKNQIVPEGSYSSIPYDPETETVLGEPEAPEPYDVDIFDDIPFDDLLEEDFDIADAIDDDDIDTAIREAQHHLDEETVLPEDTEPRTDEVVPAEETAPHSDEAGD